MILMPTPDEALEVGPGPPLKQAEAIRLFAEVLGSEVAVRADLQLTPFAAWSVWFFRWVKGRMSGIEEAAFYQLLRKLSLSRLAPRLDYAWDSWEDDNRPVEGFDIVFCDGYKVTWTGVDVFFNVLTLKTTDFVQPPPLEKLGLDAMVLFKRSMTRVINNREEAKDGNPRGAGEAGTGSPRQGSS